MPDTNPNWTTVALRMCGMLEKRMVRLEVDYDRSDRVNGEIYLCCSYKIVKHYEAQVRQALPDEFLWLMGSIPGPIQMSLISDLDNEFDAVLFKELDAFLQGTSRRYPRLRTSLAYGSNKISSLAAALQTFYVAVRPQACSLAGFVPSLGILVALDERQSQKEVFRSPLSDYVKLALKDVLERPDLHDLDRLAEEVMRLTENPRVPRRFFL